MLSFLGTEIGRGHPFYLDGVRRALTAMGRDDVVASESDVFAVSRGASRLAWGAVRAAYRIAGRGGLPAALYHRLRGTSDYDRESAMLTILGRDLRRWAAATAPGPLVVDHPAVVGALGSRPDVWYVHGEMIAPPEAIVRGAAGIFVPNEAVAAEFVRGGVAPGRLRVTGICIENELVPGAEAAAVARRERLESVGPYRIGFFGSGAEPVAHVASMASAAGACAQVGHDVLVFAKRGGRLARVVERELETVPIGSEIIEYDTREELDRRTAEVLPSVDLVVSPPHERSNWAVALGIPFFLVGPDIGPFAPRNRALLLRAGVALELPDPATAEHLPGVLVEMQSKGILSRMAENGWGPPIDGFREAARFLMEEAESDGGPPARGGTA